MNFDKELDARGLNCPLPILRTKKALTDLQSGQVLKVLATDPGSVKDFQTFARQTGHELLSHAEANREFTFFMKKVNSRFASACDSSSCPVWRAKVWKSFTEPGSVASTLSTWPDCRSVSAFFVRRMGSGQFSPRASSSLSKFMGDPGQVAV